MYFITVQFPGKNKRGGNKYEKGVFHQGLYFIHEYLSAFFFVCNIFFLINFTISPKTIILVQKGSVLQIKTSTLGIPSELIIYYSVFVSCWQQCAIFYWSYFRIFCSGKNNSIKNKYQQLYQKYQYDYNKRRCRGSK